MDAGTGAQHRLLPPGWTPVDPEPAPATGPTVLALRVTAPDGTPLWLHVVDGELPGATGRRLRTELPALDELLRAVTAERGGAVLLPWLEHGDAASAHPYLVSARPGPTLAEMLLRGPLPARQVVAVALTCVEALHVLHRHGRSHGLLAPQHLHREPQPGGDRLRLGSPLPSALAELVAVAGGTGHEPPEVLRGGDPSPAADVFGLASTCWTLLAGRPPFGADQLARLTAAEPPPLGRRDVPTAMEAALRAALSPDPGRRPDLTTLAQALRILTDGAAPVGDVAPAREPSDERQDTLAPTRPVGDAGRPLGSRYLLDALIGRGATGHVWRGHVRDDGRAVAVKLLRPELAEDPEVVTRFMRERAALMRLSHPNLVAVHDLVAEGGALAIVMDLVEGRDLRTALATGALPPARAATLLAQTAAALTAVHAAGFVHRDLKPENVILESGVDGRARLTDFGLARAVESSVLTRQTQLVGTPAYVAPEVVAGREPGPAVDVYALGVTACELLSGRRPFTATSTAAVLRAHLDEPPRRPEALPEELWPLVESCLRKDPAARPSAADLATAWERVAAGQAPGALPAAPPTAPPAPSGGVIDTPLRSPAPHDPAPHDRQPVPDELWSSTGSQPTTTSERPLGARHAGPVAERGGRAKLWWSLAAIVLLGFGGGFAFFAFGKDEPASRSYAQYPLPAQVSLVNNVPVVTWSYPRDIAQDGTSVVITRIRDNAGTPLNPSGLPIAQRKFNAGTLRAGDCVVVLANRTTKPPPDDARVKPACLRSTASPSPSSGSPSK